MHLDPRYRLTDAAAAEIVSPALAVYPALIYENVGKLVKAVGDKPERLRPHAKTVKTPQFVRFWQAFGVTKHKCATIAEAEMLAEAGARDVVLAYPLVGPHAARFWQLQAAYPQTTFRPIVDHPDHIEMLERSAPNALGPKVETLVDVDVGMARTGAAVGDRAAALYRRLADSPALSPGGLHVYDGHTNQADAADRARQVSDVWKAVQELVRTLEATGSKVPRIVVGGTGGFPAWAEIAAHEPRLECSPGTLVLNDAGYRKRYADLDFFPAAVLLGRVVSKPATGLLTIDLGSKAVAPDSDPKVRVQLLNVPDAEVMSQHEEHLVVRTPVADATPLGFLVYAWPNHICPTVALQQELLVVENGAVVDAWPVVARDRRLTV